MIAGTWLKKNPTSKKKKRKEIRPKPSILQKESVPLEQAKCQ